MKKHNNHKLDARFGLRVYMFILLALAGSSICLAQQPAELQQLIAEIDQNNTTLKAMRQSVEAQKMGNRTGLNPDDPEVGINYLRSNARLSDRRLDFNISQKFEFPTVYTHRRKMAKQQNEALDIDYQLQRHEIMDEAVRTWLQWLYHKAYRSILALQNEHAQQIADSYQKAFIGGEINILERNKARIHAINIRKAYDSNEIKLQATHDQLIRLNGGKLLRDIAMDFPDWELPVDAGHWLEEANRRSMLLRAMEKNTQITRTQQQVIRAMQFPNLQVGFMREQDIEVDFRGVTLGMSIPLWQHRNRGREAKLQVQAQELLALDASQQFEIRQRSLHREAMALKKQRDELRTVMNDTKGPELMKRALDLGEITLIDYLVEQSIYYELMTNVLESELTYHLVIIDMRKWLVYD